MKMYEIGQQTDLRCKTFTRMLQKKIIMFCYVSLPSTTFVI